MKKIILLIIIVFVAGCNKSDKAVDVVKKYLNGYINLDKDVIKNLDKIINENEELSEENKALYKKIFLRQYKDLKYTIISEDYSSDIALVKVNINVYNINEAENNAFYYLSKNLKEFYTEDNTFDNNSYTEYKLNLILNSKDRIDYEITFALKSNDNRWILEQPTDEDLQKIHGMYV